MANRYGEAALLAVRMESFGKTASPLSRWGDAVKKLYPTTPIAQKKAAPRAAFLGLCEAGLVKGIHGDAFASPNKNKIYAVEAVRLLQAGTHKTVTQLWAAVTDGEQIPHASQMDIVLALWKNGLIVSQRDAPGGTRPEAVTRKEEQGTPAPLSDKPNSA